MAQYFMDFYGMGGPKNMGGRIKVFDNLIDARKYAVQFLKTQNRLVEKKFENYEKGYLKTMPYAVYGVKINTIKNGIVSHCGYVKKETTSSGKVKFTWRGYTINPNGTLRKSAKKGTKTEYGIKGKLKPFGL